MNYGEIFAREGFEESPNRHKRRSPHILELIISPDMYEDFAYAWCRNNRLIDMLSFKLRIIGFFSARHPMSYNRNQAITIYLQKVG